MLNDGFQELEQRDGNNKIVKAGVVSQDSDVLTVYETIAENFRALNERLNKLESRVNTLEKK